MTHDSDGVAGEELDEALEELKRAESRASRLTDGAKAAREEKLANAKGDAMGILDAARLEGEAERVKIVAAADKRVHAQVGQILSDAERQAKQLRGKGSKELARRLAALILK